MAHICDDAGNELPTGEQGVVYFEGGWDFNPRVADAAVIGVPNPDFGEEVKAVVQPLDPADATPEFAAELIAFCKSALSPVKCPRSVDFDPALPRLDNGKLYKRLIKDRYWSGQK